MKSQRRELAAGARFCGVATIGRDPGAVPGGAAVGALLPVAPPSIFEVDEAALLEPADAAVELVGWATLGWLVVAATDEEVLLLAAAPPPLSPGPGVLRGAAGAVAGGGGAAPGWPAFRFCMVV